MNAPQEHLYTRARIWTLSIAGLLLGGTILLAQTATARFLPGVIIVGALMTIQAVSTNQKKPSEARSRRSPRRVSPGQLRSMVNFGRPEFRSAAKPLANSELRPGHPATGFPTSYEFPLDNSSQQATAFIRDFKEGILGLTLETAKTEGASAKAALDVAETKSGLEAIVSVLVRAVEAKDPYTAGHSERVKLYASLIAKRLGLPEHEIRVLEIGCLLHDIGKIGVPDQLLTKNSSLTEDEFKVIALHPMLGYQILSGLHLFEECLSIVRHHHERLDGSGYPDGLKGDQIPVLVRITMVADSFDAMTSTRAYRTGMHPLVAMQELERDAKSGKLDLKIVGILADMVRENGLPGRKPDPLLNPSTTAQTQPLPKDSDEIAA